MAPKKQANSTPAFEEALENLESIVESLESGETTLAEMVEQFEKGSQLLKTCQERLKEAESKIEILKKSGEAFEFEAFEADSET